MVLPYALDRFVPAGLLGFLIAGLLAAFMSNFAATVNAAPPYIVNDIYKRYINPDASPRTYVRLSYVSSFAVVVLGITFGWFVSSINSVVQWIVSALWGGYMASNILKWYWWRFNGFGYFWGMVAGIGGSLILPFAFPHVLPLMAFPLLLGFSFIGCILGTLLTKPEDDEVLKDFYRRVRPWGFWGPVLKKVLQDDPSFQRNKDFPRDVFNIVIGMIWQTALVPLPIYIVIWNFKAAAITFAVVVVTSIILKFSWYDRLNEKNFVDVAPPRSKEVATIA
jgi:MFS family permease